MQLMCKASSFIISSVNLYFLHVSLFILFISLILSLKHSIEGFMKEYLLSFNFTMVIFIGALFLVKNTGSPLTSMINRSIKGLSFSNCPMSLFLLNLICI